MASKEIKKQVEKYIKEEYTEEIEQRSKNKYIITKQNEPLLNISQQMIGISKGEEFVQIDLEGNYTTEHKISQNAYIKLYKKPNGLDFLNNYNEDDLKANLENIYKSIDQSTAKLLDIFIYKLTEQGNLDENHTTISIDIKEYAQLLNGGQEPTRSQINNAREKIKKGVDALKYISYTYKKGKTSHLNIALYGGTDAIHNGKVHFKFNSDFIRLNFYTKGYLNVVPLSILSLNELYNPHAYLTAKKILSLRRNNRGDIYRETHFKVKTLLDFVISLPRYRDAKTNQIICRQPTQKIVEPFEKTLDAIENTGIFKWHYDSDYIDKQSNPNYKFAFEDFENADIIIEWNKDFEEQDKSIIEGRKKHEQKLLKASKTKKKK